MRLITWGQKLGGGWRRATGAVLTSIVLSAVVGLALLGSDAFASWTTPEQTVSASGGLLPFEAPTSTLLRLQGTTNVPSGKEDAALVKDWRYTQVTLDEFLQIQQDLFNMELFVDQLLSVLSLQFAFNAEFALLRPSGSPSS